jgi:hypothetical protein
MLGRKRDHRGGAAERRRDGGAFERVGIEDTGGRDLLDLSTPPGSTSFPRASISLAPGGRLRPTAAMVSPSIATSAGNTADEVATVPPRSTRS